MANLSSMQSFAIYSMQFPPIVSTDSTMNLVLRIRELRKARGLTIAQLAAMINVSVPHMSEVERGKKNLNNHLMTRIAAALNVRPQDLIAENDEITRLNSILGNLSPQDIDRVEAFALGLLETAPGNTRKK